MTDVAVSELSAVCPPGDPGYDEAVRIWNAAISRRPSLVVRCGAAADVAVAVNHAIAEGLEISVRAADTPTRDPR